MDADLRGESAAAVDRVLTDTEEAKILLIPVLCGAAPWSALHRACCFFLRYLATVFIRPLPPMNNHPIRSRLARR